MAYSDATSKLGLVTFPVEGHDEVSGLCLITSPTNHVRPTRTLASLLIASIVNGSTDVTITRPAALQVVTHAPVTRLQQHTMKQRN